MLQIFKKRTRISWCVVLLTAAVSVVFLPGPSSVAQSPGLVAAYGLNEGAGNAIQDGSGNSNTGAISGATWTPSGKFSGALSFNGNGYVTVPNSSSLDISGTGFTLELWAMRKDTAGADQVLIGKDGLGQFYHYGLEYQNGGGVSRSVFTSHVGWLHGKPDLHRAIYRQHAAACGRDL